MLPPHTWREDSFLAGQLERPFISVAGGFSICTGFRYSSDYFWSRKSMQKVRSLWKKSCVEKKRMLKNSGYMGKNRSCDILDHRRQVSLISRDTGDI